MYFGYPKETLAKHAFRLKVLIAWEVWIYSSTPYWSSNQILSDIRNVQQFVLLLYKLNAMGIFYFMHLSVYVCLICTMLSSLTLSLPNATVVEFTVHCQTRLQSKFKGTVDSCLFLTVLRNAFLCSLFQIVQGT